MQIAERQEPITKLWERLGGATEPQSQIEEKPERETDETVIANARKAANGEKFDTLYRGEWQNLYPSQSEADFALVDIIAYYTQNRAQIERIFLASGLGQRDKAKRRDYLQGMIARSLDRQLPPVPGQREFVANLQFNSQLPAVAPNALRYRLLDSAAVAAMPSVKWALHGIFPAQGLAAIAGPSGSGKSFLAQDLGCAIADGGVWFGRRVRRASAVYVGLEGELGFRTRVAAFKAAYGRSPQILMVLGQTVSLIGPADVPDLASAIKAQCGPEPVVFIDTLNRAALGIDENSAKDMGAVLSGAASLQRLTGGLVVLIHHTGKDVTKGLRGHSSLFAACDGVIEVSREGNDRAWRIAKSKDGADGQAFAFTLEQIDLGTDDQGEGVTSCVVRPEGNAKGKPSKLSKADSIALAALAECRIQGKDVPPPQAVLDSFKQCTGQPLFPPFCVVPEHLWRTVAYDKGISDAEQDAKKKAFRRSRAALIELGMIRTYADYYWLPEWCAPASVATPAIQALFPDEN